MREVELGSMTDKAVVVFGGLEAGENVAVDGNFLIDSQMQLEGKPSLIDPSKNRAASPSMSAGGHHAH